MPDGPARTVVGLLLVVPAAVALLVGHVWPTLRTIWASLRTGDALDGGEFVGLDNYAAVGREAAAGMASGLLLAALPLATLLAVGPLLGYAAHRAGRAARWTTRLALAVPMVSVAPVALALVWLPDRGTGLSATVTTLWLTTVGLVSGVGATLYLAVLRGRTPGRSAWPAGLAVGAVAAAATVAVSLQAFAYPVLLGSDAPLRAVFIRGFLQAGSGPASALATLLLTLLMVLGLGTALVVILSGLRIAVDPARPAQPSGPVPRGGGSAGRVVAMVATGGLLVLVLSLAGYGLWPWLASFGDLVLAGGPWLPEQLAIAWVPLVISAAVGTLVAAAAGFGIGALRPLGRWSELLLLPFAPWLFVGTGPLALARLEAALESAAIGGALSELPGPVAVLVPRVWLVVPALFIFTVLFRGQHGKCRELVGSGVSRAIAYGRTLVAALPMLALVVAATWLVNAQSLLRSLTGLPIDGVTLLSHIATRGRDAVSPAAAVALVLPLPALLVFAVALGLLQVLYLDRTTIRVGRPG
jgi:ABC-type sugar transport system permease subunit